MTLARSATHQFSAATKWTITFAGEDIKSTYRNLADVQLLLYEIWTATYHHLASVDGAAHVAHLANSSDAWWWVPQGSGSRYYVLNALEELDEVDEFYLDRSERAVYVGLHPEDDPNADNADPFILAAGNRELVRINDTAGVSFRSLEFAHTPVENGQWICGQSAALLETAAVHVSFARDVSFANCTFRATGGYGFWTEQETSDVSVVGSLFTDLGAGGIRVGRNYAETPECENHTFSDNIITDGGHWFKEGVGVLAQFVGNVTISHNEISYMRYSGISTGWTWGYGPTPVHDIRATFNHIHHIGLGYLSDMACVYNVGAGPGSVVGNNYCHDVQSYNYGGWAYYTDEGSRGILFENNIAYRTKCAGHHQHYGTDNVIRNNLYVDVNIGDEPTPGRQDVRMTSCDYAIATSTHKRNCNSCPYPEKTPENPGCCCHPGCDQGMCSSWNFSRNIVYLPKGNPSTFVGTSFPFGLMNFSFDNNVYYSEGVGSTARMFNGSRKETVGNGQANLAGWQGLGKDLSSVVGDPNLDPAPLLADPWPLAKTLFGPLRLGFEPIDVGTVGPRAASCAPQSLIGCDSSESGTATSLTPLLSLVERLGLIVHVPIATATS
jgi:hypothetical protein